MYKVEYLIIVDKVNTTTVQSLKNLIQSDDEITLTKTHLKVGENSFEYEIAKGSIFTGDKSTYFHLKFSCGESSEIEDFSGALRKVRGRLSMINKAHFTLWDDISMHYSTKAYNKIYHIENLMRKLLTKFMLVNLGMDWTSERIPSDVKNSININNKDVNFLNNIDFIKLSDFLFSENYPSHKESVIKKLTQAKDLTSLDINEIKSLLPESNWSKYFASIVECEGEYLNKIWKKLYELRNSIAHNKSFSLTDEKQVEELTSEIGGYLEDAISKLDEVVIPESEIENVVENVVSERNEQIGLFIDNYRQFEYNLQSLYRQIHSSADKIGAAFIPLRKVLSELSAMQLVPKELVDSINKISSIRNIIVHGTNIEFHSTELNKYSAELEDYTEKIKKLLQVDEAYHTESIKDKKILEAYQELKSRMLTLKGVQAKYNKHYISFVRDRNIVDVKIQQKSIKIWINLNKGELKDPEGLAKDVSTIGHLGNGDYEITITSLNQIESIMDLIHQSYDYKS